MNGIKTAVMLIVLVSMAWATNIDNANFTERSRSFYVVTDLQFTSDFTAMSGGRAVSSGDTVTAGNITITPSFNGRWATPDLSVLNSYPNVPGTICQHMRGYTSGVATSQPVTWLDPTTFDSHKNFGTYSPVITDSSSPRVAQLTPFVTQRVTYMNSTGTYPNKEGGVQLYCKGTLQVLLDGVSAANSTLPTVNAVDMAVNTSGSHTISTRMTNVSCFAVVVKHPEQQGTECYALFYFTNDSRANIPPVMANTTITITITPSGGNCSFNHTDITASASPGNADIVLMNFSMHNNADAIQVANVTSSNPSSYSVEPFPTLICATLGFPSSLCPSSNGFNQTIAAGADHSLMVLFTRSSGASGPLTITFSAHTTLPQPATCSDSATFNDDDTPFTCTMVPPSLRLAPYDVGRFTLGCQNLRGDTVDCQGNNWSWTTLRGDFVERDNTHALAYTDNSVRGVGRLNYRSITALCGSDVDNTGPSPWDCTFNPASATLFVEQSQYFQLICNVTPSAATYNLTNGLNGTLTDPSTAGVNYTAPTGPTAGNLRGFAEFTSAPAYTVGRLVFAPITVIATPIRSCEITPALVAPPAINLSPMEIMEWDVTCRDASGIPTPCVGTDWRWESGLNGNVPVATNAYADAYSTSAGGSAGLLSYYTAGANCSSNVTLYSGPLRGWCDLDPTRANLKFNVSRYFALRCFDNRSGTPVPFTPDSADYNRVAGLAGSLSNGSVAGVTYVAPSYNNSGMLEALAWTTLFPGIAGFAALASITVSETGEGGGPDTGDTEWCTIDGRGVTVIGVFPNETYWIGIKCGKFYNETCSLFYTRWDVRPSEAANWRADNTGISISIIGKPGTVGTISAVVDKDGHGCSKAFYINKPDCLEFS